MNTEMDTKMNTKMDTEMDKVYDELKPIIFIDDNIDIIDSMDIYYTLNYENFNDNLLHDELENKQLKNYLLYRIKEKMEKDDNKINTLMNVIYKLFKKIQILKNTKKY
jgi:hypothetical protein